ncbi:hypothetical protein CHH56_15215 [Terribacillus saccharophilus]|nr:hypothetical protein CHH56_15215 [Terribacillus saccharophilus]
MRRLSRRILDKRKRKATTPAYKIYERDSFEKIYDYYKAFAEYKGETFNEEKLDAEFLKEVIIFTWIKLQKSKNGRIC